MSPIAEHKCVCVCVCVCVGVCVCFRAAVFTALRFLYTYNLSHRDYNEVVCVCQGVGEWIWETGGAIKIVFFLKEECYIGFILPVVTLKVLYVVCILLGQRSNIKTCTMKMFCHTLMVRFKEIMARTETERN